jgi:hypothetical protein
MSDKNIKITETVELELHMNCMSWCFTALLRDNGKWFGEVGHADTEQGAFEDLVSETNKALTEKLAMIDHEEVQAKLPAALKLAQEIKDLRKALQCFAILRQEKKAA